MWNGAIVSIHVAPEARAPMQSVHDAQIVAGHGIEGDRYRNDAGTFSDKPGPDRHVTLIALEDVEAFTREHGIPLAPGETRRNVVTRGVPVNDLIGVEFTIGAVTLRGLRLCEPCAHLAKLTGRAVLPGLVGRGGLRCEALTSGMIVVGDPVSPIHGR
ncbi:MAG: MOSC domain-containing protein [Polyangiales bacterium]